jgi:hypothetical protein
MLWAIKFILFVLVVAIFLIIAIVSSEKDVVEEPLIKNTCAHNNVIGYYINCSEFVYFKCADCHIELSKADIIFAHTIRYEF